MTNITTIVASNPEAVIFSTSAEYKTASSTKLNQHTLEYELDELVQERRNSSALAMELRLSCINPSKFVVVWTTSLWYRYLIPPWQMSLPLDLTFCSFVTYSILFRPGVSFIWN